MDITFADKKLKKYANDNKAAIKKLGNKRAGIFQTRLEDMADTDSFADLEHLPGRFHQLKEDRADQWACDLDHPKRLLFKPGEDPIPKNKDGRQLLAEIKTVEILEINNYHKKG